jgi:hypothetical protein
VVLVRPQPVASSAGFATARFLWGPLNHLDINGTTSIDATALNDADNSVASVFMADKDGTVDRVGFSISAKTGSDATVKYFAGLVTVDASGHPTSTAYGGSTPANPTQASLSTGWNWLTLVGNATMVAGDLVAVRIWHDGSSTAPTAANVTVRHAQRVGGQTSYNLPYADVFTTAWAKAANLPISTYRYADGTVANHPIVVLGATNTAFNTGTTPDETGAKFQLPWPAVCRGARVVVDVATPATNAFVVKLYDAADGLLASATVPAATVAFNVASQVNVFWDAVALAADTDYRLTVLPTTTDNTQISVLATPDTDSKQAIACGDRFGYTTRTDAGAWTDTALTVPMVGLWLEGTA